MQVSTDCTFDAAADEQVRLLKHASCTQQVIHVPAVALRTPDFHHNERLVQAAARAWQLEADELEAQGLLSLPTAAAPQSWQANLAAMQAQAEQLQSLGLVAQLLLSRQEQEVCLTSFSFACSVLPLYAPSVIMYVLVEW